MSKLSKYPYIFNEKDTPKFTSAMSSVAIKIIQFSPRYTINVSPLTVSGLAIKYNKV